jgi:phage shock protein E
MSEVEKLIHTPGTHLVDVRTPEEVAEVSVEGAVNIPLDTLTQHVEDFKHMSESGEVVLFCRSGARSGRALDFLQQQGINRLHNGGGYADVLHIIKNKG